MEYANEKYLSDVGIFVKWPLEERLTPNQNEQNYFW